jgi:ABC-type branched-subunit amino acid transport system ATPase component
MVRGTRTLAPRTISIPIGGRWQLSHNKAKSQAVLGQPGMLFQPSIVDEIGEMLLTLNKSWGLSIVVIEQNLEFVAARTSSVAIIQNG